MRGILCVIVVVSGLIETAAAVSLAIMRWDHPILRRLLDSNSMGISIEFSPDRIDLPIYFAALVFLLCAALHFLALRWLRDEKEEAHHLLNLYGTFSIVGGVLLFLAVGTVGLGWFFLIVDSLRGALLLSFSIAVFLSPQTLSKLQLPGARTSRSSRVRRSSERVGRGRSRRVGGDRSARDRGRDVQRGERSARDRGGDAQRGERSARDRGGDAQRGDRSARSRGEDVQRGDRSARRRWDRADREPAGRRDRQRIDRPTREGVEGPESEGSDRPDRVSGDRTRRAGRDRPTRSRRPQPRRGRPAGEDAQVAEERREARRRPDRSRRKSPDSRPPGRPHDDKTPGDVRETGGLEEARKDRPHSPVRDSSDLPWGLVRDIPSQTSDVRSGGGTEDGSSPTGGREIQAGRRPKKGRYSTGALFRPRPKRSRRPLGGAAPSTTDRKRNWPEHVSSSSENKNDKLDARTARGNRSDEPDTGTAPAPENSSADTDREKQGTNTNRRYEDDE
ncbi:MAG: hypothetical protein KAY24_06650 [Candidatus Eisenbacteria sp.]|nr:hypothetical protein [Candidatus Eisenbacteria bacterium]